MKYLTIYFFFIITATLVLLNRYTALYISDFRLHFVLLFVASATFVITVAHIFGKLKTAKSIVLTFLVVGALCFIKAFFSWGGDWKTERVEYRHIENPNRTIDYQMRGDRFAFGYKKRIVEIRKLAPYVEWTTDIDTISMNQEEWERISEQHTISLDSSK